VRPTGAKIFADGVIEARTAFMLAPYLDRPSERGLPFWSDERLRPLVARLAREDFDVHVHAIGDGAVRQALDAFEGARGGASARGPRFEIAHLQVIDPADVPRFRQLGVFAVFQPLWAFADRYVTELTWPALGPERSRWMYPLASVARAGGRLAFGSDWAVSSLDPLPAIQVAVTRRAYDGRPGEVMHPEERLDLPRAIAAYTIGAAAANGLEAETGSIEVGKRADLVVLSDDLFARAPEEIAQARVLLTLVDGQPAYRDPALAW
jgi:predicted amidohydrolase YtcJ